MRKWCALLLAAALAFAGAAPAFAAEEGVFAEGAEQSQSEQAPLRTIETSVLPSLKVYYGDQQVQAVRNGYRWEEPPAQDAEAVGGEPAALFADTIHPLETEPLKGAAFERQPKAEQIWLQFSQRPQSIRIERWESGGRGKRPFPQPVVDKLESGSLKLPADGNYLYQVTAEWAQGQVRYLFEIGPAPEVAVYTEKPIYREGTASVTVKLTNNTGGNLSYNEEYELHRYGEDGRWYVVPLSGAFQTWTGVIMPGQTVSCPEPIKAAKPLESGRYRLVKRAYGNGKTYPLYAEFEIGTPQGLLDLGSPDSIFLSVGDGEPVQLTRRGRYGGRSPLAYVMSELARFEPAPQGMRLISTARTDGAQLTLSYANGARVELTLDPNVSMLKDGQYHPVVSFRYQGEIYLAERAVFGNIQSCAAYVLTNPSLLTEP